MLTSLSRLVARYARCRRDRSFTRFRRRRRSPDPFLSPREKHAENRVPIASARCVPSGGRFEFRKVTQPSSDTTSVKRSETTWPAAMTSPA